MGEEEKKSSKSKSFHNFCRISYKTCIVMYFYFIWLPWVLDVACRIFSCSMWDLVPWPGTEPMPPVLGAQGINYWTTMKFPE